VSDKVKIAIVGSGPGGLAAATVAAKKGISHVLLEKTDHYSDTIYKYQKGKHIMATPDKLSLHSNMDIKFHAASREQILAMWTEAVEGAGANVRFNSEVKAITGRQGDFTLELASGGSVQAEYVVIAMGLQGNINKLRCPGADLPHVQYTVDDASAYWDENVVVIGVGDAGIENAVALSKQNKVTIFNRRDSFPNAKTGNVSLVQSAIESGRITHMPFTEVKEIHEGYVIATTKDGEAKVPCDRVVARLGAAPPRKFLESCGIEFASNDRTAVPQLTPQYESNVPGLFLVGAVAGYPLIKHCMNQGHEVVHYIEGIPIKPADEPLLEQAFAPIPGKPSVDESLRLLQQNVTIFNELTTLQLREFMLDATVHYKRANQVVFRKNEFGDSLWCIVQGSVLVELVPGAAKHFKEDPVRGPSKDDEDTGKPSVIPIPQGDIFGEIGLISGRRRSATIVAAEDAVLVEIPRNAALKLISTAPQVKRAIEHTVMVRQLANIFGSGLTREDISKIANASTLQTIPAGEVLIKEGDQECNIFIIRSGSVTISKQIGGKEVFLNYVPAGLYVGEMALVGDGVRTATARAAIKTDVIKIDGEVFTELFQTNPQLKQALMAKAQERQVANASAGGDEEINDIVQFLVRQGVGEATDVLLIDEELCIGCDNCELACAETHSGISRLDREAGPTFDALHVPTSCRHCEHPHCMADCPPDAIHRAPDGEVYIDDSCIGCGNCQRNCPYGVIQMEAIPPKKPSLLQWLLFGAGPGPGQDTTGWSQRKLAKQKEKPQKWAVKCDMCKGIKGGPACVRACPTGAAIRVSPEEFLNLTRRSAR